MENYDNRKRASRNYNNGNGSKFNPSCDENQHEQSRSMSESPSSMENNCTADAAILYFRFISREMENQINELEKAIENITATNRTQKQNIMDMQIQKQKMLSEFHEQYRKYEQKAVYENQLGEKIENVSQFLQELIAQKTEICNMKTGEINIRNYITTKFQSNYEELKIIVLSYEAEVQRGHDKINEIREVESKWEAYDKLNSEMDSFMQKYNEHLNYLRWAIKNENLACEQIKIEGESIRTPVIMKALEWRQALENNIVKTQRNFCFLKNEFFKFKDQPHDEICMKETVEKLQKKLSKKILKTKEIESKISTVASTIEELARKNRKDLIQLKSVEDDIKLCIEEKKVLADCLTRLKVQINDDTVAQGEVLRTRQFCEEKVNHAVAEIEKLKQQEKLRLLTNDLSSEWKQKEILLKEIHEVQNQKVIEKELIMNLETDIAAKKERINKLKRDLLSKNIHADDSEKEDFLNKYLTIEYEENTSLEFTESQLNNLMEKICQMQPYVQQLEETLEECVTDGDILDKEIISSQKTLQKLIDDAKICENSIQTLKQNVYQGKYITQQDLNKKLNILITGEKNEQEAVDKLKEEIAEMEENKKRSLLAPDSRQKSTANRAKRSTMKNQNSQRNEEAAVSSPDSDIYTFK